MIAMIFYFSLYKKIQLFYNPTMFSFLINCLCRFKRFATGELNRLSLSFILSYKFLLKLSNDKRAISALETKQEFIGQTLKDYAIFLNRVM